MNQSYLFGEPGERIQSPSVKTKSVGTATPIGSGPEGEKCRTCKFATKTGRHSTFYKCKLMEHCWTHGPATDIKLKYDACRYWETKR